MDIPSLKQVEERIGIPVVEWAGNCYGIAVKVNEAYEDLGGHALYGHYLGPIHPLSIFAGRGIVQHGWILLPDGTVLDPTRWAFDSPNDPYLFHGSADHYDEGGNQWRALSARPVPEFDAERVLTTFNPPLTGPVQRLVGDTEVWSVPQVYWLASLAYDVVGQECLKYILDNFQFGTAAIPKDNLGRLRRELGLVEA